MGRRGCRSLPLISPKQQGVGVLRPLIGGDVWPGGEMTYQPPGGAPPEPTPYAQPQDPWAGGHEPGVVAAPTDPIPHHGFEGGGYVPGVAAPNVWAQETVAQ